MNHSEMTNTSAEVMEQLQERIDRVTEDLLMVETKKKRGQDQLFMEIGGNKNNSRVEKLDDILELCHLIKGQLSSPNPLEQLKFSNKVHFLLDACDYLLDYIEAVASGNPLPATPVTLFEQVGYITGNQPQDSLSVEKVIFESDGITAVSTPSSVKMQLPNVTSRQHRNAIIASLQYIFDFTTQNQDWEVNVAALEKLPISILGALVSHQADFNHRGRCIRLVGVTEGILATSCMDTLLNVFPCTMKVPS